MRRKNSRDLSIPSSLHFMETDIEISISGRKNVRSGCYPTIFDPTKAKETTIARAKRIDNRKSVLNNQRQESLPQTA